MNTMKMVGVVAAFVATTVAAVAADAEICKWKDGKKAVFLLAFDDSCKSHADNAIPELIKRGIPATFYVCPGQTPWLDRRDWWEEEFPTNSCIKYGNHTMTHKGAPTLEFIDEDIRKCQEVIYKCFPKEKNPRLISFGQPGGVPWKITDAQREELLKKYNLVLRPDFNGIHFGCKNTADVLALVDKAIEKGEMGHHDTHGVGGDWGVMPLNMFNALLDKLEATKDVVWTTDHISYHKYLKEREGAKLETISSSKKEIALKLTTTTDAELYDMPLTLNIKVPETWTKCAIEQGKKNATAKVENGLARFDVEPISSAIKIRKAN